MSMITLGRETEFFLESSYSLRTMTKTISLGTNANFSDEAKAIGIVGYYDGHNIDSLMIYYFDSAESLAKFQMIYL